MTSKWKDTVTNHSANALYQRRAQIRKAKEKLKEKHPNMKKAGEEFLGSVRNTLENNEDGNVALDSLGKSEGFTENTVHTVHRFQRHRAIKKVKKAVKAEKKAFRKEVNFRVERYFAENPQQKPKHFIQKMYQKKKMQRRFSKELNREILKQAFGSPAQGGSIVSKLAGFLKNKLNPKVLLKWILGGAGIWILVFSLLSSCSTVSVGVLSGAGGVSYQSKPDDIDATDILFSKKEMELQNRIDHIETDYPGYDEYRYNLDEIGHNPSVLINYLSAKLTRFTIDDVKSELENIFNTMYDLELNPITEMRTRTVHDEDGDHEEQYPYYILEVTLKRKPMEEIVEARLDDQQKEVYDSFGKTGGFAQVWGSPVNFNWHNSVSSYYGYRKDAADSQQELHRGLDISLPEGTEVFSMRDGTVEEVGQNEEYGTYIIIRDEYGYESRYAHLSGTLVHEGDTVSGADLIGRSGSTGSETGSTLHIEILYDGQYYNPLFYCNAPEDANASPEPAAGGAGGSFTPPAEALNDAEFARMLAEGEKYVGRKYVWGGASPSTGFDCSGFVSWVINHSGNGWNVGRQTANGLLNSCCSRISPSDAKPGDLIFFQGTYNTSGASHVGIYVGNNTMLHCGDPIKFTNISTAYWQSHFYTYGRIKGKG